MQRLLVLALALGLASADFYLHGMRGSNNRLNEQSANRDDANRMFDSQNNNRGGYNCGDRSDGAANSDNGVDATQNFNDVNSDGQYQMAYYENSIVTIEWTNQHGCGGNPVDAPHQLNCNIVLQYICDTKPTPANNNGDYAMTTMMRDGTTTNQATEPNTWGVQSGDTTTGRHEPDAYYYECKTRKRNQGLFLADQNLNGDTAIYTRQNPNGDRSGLECAEERDYYPYWHPSPWKDVAVLVDSKSQCGFYQKNSQNVLAKNYCNGTTTAQQAANNERDCLSNGGVWATVPAWGNGKPDCVEAYWNRDNHLGNAVDGNTNSYNWTLPKADSEACINDQCACVLRIRYNITVGEVTADMDSRNSGAYSPVTDDPTVTHAGFNFTLALDTAQTGRTFQDRSYMFRIIPRPAGIPNNAKIYNLNVRGKRGNIVQTYPATEYDFVPTFLEVNKNDFVHFQWTGCDTNPAGNAGEGRTSTDRSNIVQIEDMSKNYPIADDKATLFKDPQVRALMANIGQTGCLNYTALLAKNNNNQGQVEQDLQNCMKLNANKDGYFNGGLVKMTELGSYYYMSTRNNNFSNRSQKASIKVRNPWPAWKTAVIVVGGVVAVAIGAAAGTVFYAKRNPHSRVAEVVRKVPGLKSRI